MKLIEKLIVIFFSCSSTVSVLLVWKAIGVAMRGRFFTFEIAPPCSGRVCVVLQTF